MSVQEKIKGQNGSIEALFQAGAHFGLIRSRRHPSTKPFLFGVKNKIEIFDLEKTQDALDIALAFVKKKVSEGGTILFLGGKNEARKAVAAGAQKAGMPYVAGRWLGGTLSNFSEIKKRIGKLESLTEQKEKGELAKYTKKERLLIDREITRLTTSFAGLLPMKTLPQAVFVIDPRREHIAVREARGLGIPVIALASSDCNLREVDYPIPANDASVKSIEHFIGEVARAIEEGTRTMPSNPSSEPKTE